jgi:hypothetical protein
VAATAASEQWRSKQQILRDLAKAFRFSAHSLEANRRGKLAPEQVRSTFLDLIRPLVFAAGCVLAPLSLWTVMVMMDRRTSPSESFSYVISYMMSPADVRETLGLFKTAVAALATLAGLIGGFWFAKRFSMALYFDLLEHTVVIREGRVESSEHEVLRKNGKDPMEQYYFHHKNEKFPVSRQAFQAIDCGAAYYIYFLPRSRRLVAVEPKIGPTDSPDGT